MRKSIRWIALVLTLVMTVGLACGCSSSKSEENQIVYANLTVGVPYDMDPAAIEQLKVLIGSVEAEDGFAFFEDTHVKIVSVPQAGTDEYEKFIKEVFNGKVDFFLAPYSDELAELVQDKKLAVKTSVEASNNSFVESLIPSQSVLSRAKKRVSYGIPFMGSYQGLFLNTDVFEKAEVAIPTDWATLTDAVAKLKEKGITPFAAGFADGANYWLDEMVLAEGGHAEHSAVPSKGVINSWKRAVLDIQKFYKDGAFNADVLTCTHDAAVQQFINKEAAMILCSSKDIAGAADDAVGFMTVPATDSGLKKANNFIAQAELAFYFNRMSLNEPVDDVTPLSAKMATMIADYFAEAEGYANVFDKEGYFPFYASAADCMDKKYEASAWEVISTGEGDLPMSNYLLCHEEFESGLAEALTGQISVDDYLANIAALQIEAQNAQKAEENK